MGVRRRRAILKKRRLLSCRSQPLGLQSYWIYVMGFCVAFWWFLDFYDARLSFWCFLHIFIGKFWDWGSCWVAHTWRNSSDQNGGRANENFDSDTFGSDLKENRTDNPHNKCFSLWEYSRGDWWTRSHPKGFGEKIFATAMVTEKTSICRAITTTTIAEDLHAFALLTTTKDWSYNGVCATRSGRIQGGCSRDYT